MFYPLSNFPVILQSKRFSRWQISAIFLFYTTGGDAVSIILQGFSTPILSLSLSLSFYLSIYLFLSLSLSLSLSLLFFFFFFFLVSLYNGIVIVAQRNPCDYFRLFLKSISSPDNIPASLCSIFSFLYLFFFKYFPPSDKPHLSDSTHRVDLSFCPIRTYYEALAKNRERDCSDVRLWQALCSAK